MGWTLEDSANNYPWRVGRKLGRTVYAQEGDVPSDDDPLLGFMESDAIAEQVVEAINHLRAPPDHPTPIPTTTPHPTKPPPTPL